MTITTMVDLPAVETNVQVDFKDVRQMMAEAFSNVNDKDDDDRPSTYTIKRALNDVGCFLNAMTDEMIAQLEPAPRKIVSEFLAQNAKRFGA